MSKIEWTDSTWNPIVGCTHGCNYCYAKKMAHRVAHMQAGRLIKENPEKYKKALTADLYHKQAENWCQKCHDFEPHFHPERLDKYNPRQKPMRVFGDSMFDWGCKENNPEWLRAIIKKMVECKQHTFQILSKRPMEYRFDPFPKNVILGTSITKGSDSNRVRQLKLAVKDNLKFVSIEPLHGQIPWQTLTGIDWVIIGAETGNRKGKVVPELWWVYDILANCAKNKIPVFIKENLLELYPELPRRQEFPEVE
jgi:protein gp37